MRLQIAPSVNDSDESETSESQAARAAGTAAGAEIDLRTMPSSPGLAGHPGHYMTRIPPPGCQAAPWHTARDSGWHGAAALLLTRSCLGFKPGFPGDSN